jgi:AbrB family looped-hinge helix DNA binding protein
MKSTIKMTPRDLSVYGTVKVGERGQVVIPADARKEFDIKAGDILLVVGAPMGDGVVLIKAEAVKEMVNKMNMGLTGQDEGETSPPARKKR